MISTKSLIITLLGVLLTVNTQAFAILGNTEEQNQNIYGKPRVIPKYNHNGAKTVVIYKKENNVITVIYRNQKSILENISYVQPVSDEVARKDVEEFILPLKEEKPLFTSAMAFNDGHFNEYIYKSGVKTKIIFNSNGFATEIISSVDSEKQISSDNGL